ncbi:NPC intracellular cholesterol transporter 2-like [Mercenaria mercenaria]|uniref:NPC intracellular cholesterol transporter 2-like n=1 Tax=Mercenaria mercenaria TaxID=6596 RepID=UPI00234E782B|nr:NPC intracellular cholesterol transporter 2-like [Mercenaria mercenaria]
MIKVVSLALAVSFVTANIEIKVHDCGSVDARINSIRVMQCEREPCIVHKGQDYTVLVNFTATRTVQEAHNHLHGGLGFLQVPFPLNPENACGKNVPCPIEAGKTYLYNNTMTCPDFAPSLRVAAKWEIKDENQKDIFCFATALQIVS